MAAFRYFQKSNQPSLAPDTNAKLFQLFLQGYSCDTIQKLHRGFSLAQIVHARVAGEWDRLQAEYLADLLELTRSRAIQATLESTNFIADLLAAANLDFGEKIRRFIMTRNPAELGSLKIEDLRDYKDAVALLQALTGQDKQQKVMVTGNVTHNIGEKATPLQAAEILKQLGTIK